MGTIDAPLGTVWVNDLEENFKTYHKEMAVRELKIHFKSRYTNQSCIVWIKCHNDGWYV